MVEKGKTEQIVTGAAKGSISAVMPYVAVGVVGYVVVKALKGKIDEGPSITLKPFLGGILGGSGLPEIDTEVIRQAGSTAKSSFIDGLSDGLSKALGLGLPPSALNTKQDDVNQWTDSQLAGLSFMNILKESGNQRVRDDLVEKFQTMPTRFNVSGAVPETKYSEKTPTQQTTAQKNQASGMPSSNLKNGIVTGTERDKTGVERIIIKYDNGITMRY